MRKIFDNKFPGRPMAFFRPPGPAFKFSGPAQNPGGRTLVIPRVSKWSVQWAELECPMGRPQGRQGWVFVRLGFCGFLWVQKYRGFWVFGFLGFCDLFFFFF